MAENSLLPNSNEQDSEDDGIVTMVDVLKAEEIMEENADAVLGPGDDKNCTYNEGYLKRQALYSCLTCLPADGSDRAGLCLACSYHCHADHELVEMYTKRNFRCDCGNSLFKGRSCTLDPVKSPVNEKNSYNQNFRGVYCTCSRPYPDPEDTVGDGMIQCIICEDWYHTRHLDTAKPQDDEDYAEMICGACTDKLPFLQYYLGYSISKVSKAGDKDESDANISVTDVDASLNSSHELVNGNTSVADETSAGGLSEDGSKTEDKKCSQTTSDNGVEETKEKEVSTLVEEIKATNTPVPDDLPKEDDSTTSTKEVESKTDKDVEKGCKLKSLKMLPRGSGATFWPHNFRKLLCACTACQEMYEGHGVPFLTDEADTVSAYEEEGKARKTSAGPTQYERGMEALSSLDRVQQMEAILSYNEMKTHLSEYLAKFVENKKVVREEDIREFFTGMQARKRQKLDIPHNCR